MEHEQHIGHQLKAIGNLMHRRWEASPVHGCAARLTGMQGWIIGYLCNNPDEELFQKDIEARFSMRRSTATGVLKLMEQNGLIVREPVARDGRLKRLILTDRARTLHREILAEIDETEALLCRGISEEELTAFLSTLEKIKHNLEAGTAADPAETEETIC